MKKNNKLILAVVVIGIALAFFIVRPFAFFPYSTIISEEGYDYSYDPSKNILKVKFYSNTNLNYYHMTYETDNMGYDPYDNLTPIITADLGCETDALFGSCLPAPVECRGYLTLREKNLAYADYTTGLCMGTVTNMDNYRISCMITTADCCEGVDISGYDYIVAGESYIEFSLGQTFGGSAPPPECTKDSQCALFGVPEHVYYCEGNNIVYDVYAERCEDGECVYPTEQVISEQCDYACKDAQCVEETELTTWEKVILWFSNIWDRFVSLFYK